MLLMFRDSKYLYFTTQAKSIWKYSIRC